MKPVRGFTLLELMVVVIIIAILAIIALPMFTEQLRKGKRSEAIQAIADLQLREERWRSNSTKYATTASAFSATDANVVTAYNNSLKYYTIAVDANSNTATAYSITATRKPAGQLANDPKCGNFTMTYNNGVSTSGVSAGDVDYCWRRK